MKHKKDRAMWIVLFAVLALTSCATTQVEYERNFWGSDNEGEINILLARSVPQLTVIVDDRIVLDARGWNTRRVDIKNLPSGSHTVKMFANSWQLEEDFQYEEKVTLGRGEKIPLMVNVPRYSTMYWIYVIGVAVISALPSVVVYY
jgi:hypothetical protein